MHASSQIEPLAIVGLSFKFPEDATSPDGLWKILEEKRCVSRRFPESRINIDGFYDEDVSGVDKLPLRQAHFLKEDLEAFDVPFFSISPTEAAAMDPQQRGLLETCYHALENAGIPIENLSESDTAVFTGSFGDDHKNLSIKDPERLSRHAGSAVAFSILANRISWWFNFKGPSMNIDTACSSSLVGLHLACQSLRSRESSVALVGGSNILSSVDQFLLMSNLGMLSPSGRCFSFDHRANGYARGEGYGVVVVKRLCDALADGDIVRVVIRSTGTNQDGRTPSLTSPSQKSQEKLIRDTYERAGLRLDTTGYVEAHGTGTPVGDPIEARALGSTLGAHRSVENPVYIGSIKSNIGHLEGGSGIAGLIKAILVLERGVIPPNANLEQVNQDIDVKALNISFPTSSIKWPTHGLRRASLNSFGFGGSNSHIVLDDAFNYFLAHGLQGHHLSANLDGPSNGRPEVEQAQSGNASLPKLLVWSASDNQASSRLIGAYTGFFASSQPANETYIDQLAFTLATRRTLLSSRFFAIASSYSQLQDLPKMASSPVRASASRSIGFIFTGQGAQYSKMGEQLLAYPVFKESMDWSNHYLRDLGCKWDLLVELARPSESTRINDPDYSQPMCTALQIALVDLLSSFSVRASVVVGHSSGEIAAAYTSGAIDHQSAVKVAYLRGQIASVLAASSDIKGGMLAANLSQPQAIQHLASFRSRNPSSTLVIACINSPSSVTLAGDETAIDDIKVYLSQANVPTSKLRVSLAYHSPHIRRASGDYHQSMGTLRQAEKQRSTPPAMVSSVTGKPVSLKQLQEPEYWVQNMESTVRFSEAIKTAMSTFANETLNGTAVNDASHHPMDMLEIGPHSTLRGPFRDIIASMKNASVHYESTLNRNVQTVQHFIETMGRLHCLGHQLDVLAVNQLTAQTCSSGSKPPLTNLPPYPFDHSKKYWHESRRSRQFRLRKVPRSILLGYPESDDGPRQMAKRWRKITRITETPWLADHVVNGSTILPAASMLSMAIEAAYQTADPDKEISAFRIKNAEFLRPLYVPDTDGGVESLIELTPWQPKGSSYMAGFSLCTLEGENWVENSSGTILIEYAQAHQDHRNGWHNDIKSNLPLPRSIDVDSLYKSFALTGLDFGPSFRSLSHVSVGTDQEAHAHIQVPHLLRSGSEDAQHVIHPITLDGIFQTILVALTQTTREKMPAAVPTAVEELWIAAMGASNPATSSLRVTAQIQERAANHVFATAKAFNEEGKILSSIGRLKATFIDDAHPNSTDSDTGGSCYHIAWKPDIDFLDSHSMVELSNGTSNSNSFYDDFDDLAVMFYHSCVDALGRIDLAKTTPDRAHMHHYLKWMKHCASGLHPDIESNASIGTDRILAPKTSGPQKNAVREGIVEFCNSLVGIMDGKVDPLELIFKSGFEKQHYDEMNARTRSAIRRIVELINFKHPGMEVLEVGAGTGSTTEVVLSHAQVQEEHNGETSVPVISSYHFTDMSSVFLSSARKKFAAKDGLMQFSLLDISQDPSTQGFGQARYDLIVASNVLHATADLNVSLANVRKLLKPGGKLMIVEITENQWVPQIVFGTLPGWWLSNDEYRVAGRPCISSSSWDTALVANGFSGADIIAHDTNNPRSRVFSVMVATAVEPPPSEDAWPRTIILADDDFGMEMAETIKAGLLNHTKNSVDIFSSLEDASNYDFSNSLAISLLEWKKPFIASIGETDFTILRGLLSNIGTILWVRGKGDNNPQFAMIDGLFRVLRSENPDIKYITMAASSTTSVEETVNNITRLINSTMLQSSSSMESEYVETAGRLSIGRAISALPVNNYINNITHFGFTTSLDPNVTYLIAGGFGGIAMSICRWMVGRGAKNLMLLSRSGPRSAEAQKLLAELVSQDVRVECPTCDITSLSSLKNVFGNSRLPPVKGCIQGALVLQDAIFSRMTYKQWTTTITPRTTGTQNLFSLLPDISFFILLSSACGILGNPSQANYSASNTYLDAFAHCHTNSNRSVISIDLGWVSFAGSVAESKQIQQNMERIGCLVPLSEIDILAMLDYYCDPSKRGSHAPLQIITGIRQGELADPSMPDLRDRPMWRTMRRSHTAGSASNSAAAQKQDQIPVSKQLSTVDSTAEASQIILQAIILKLAGDVGLAKDAIQPEKPLHGMGVDSLGAARLRTWFRAEVGANVKVFEIMSDQSLASLVYRVANRIKGDLK